jgi:hypothetical protein
MYLSWGKNDKARELIDKSIAIYEEIGAGFLLKKAKALRGKIDGIEPEEVVEEKKVELPEPEEEAVEDTRVVIADTAAKKKKTKVKEIKAQVVEAVETKEAPQRKISIPTVPSEPKLRREDKKVMIFTQADEDAHQKQAKLKLFVEFPFIDPTIEIEEIVFEENSEFAKKHGVTEAPSVVFMGKVFKGIPRTVEIGRMLLGRERESAEKQPVRTIKEPPSTSEDEEILKPHYIYLLKTKKSDKAFALFKKMTGSGFRGLCVTRPPLKRITDEYGLSNIEIIAMARSKVRPGYLLAGDIEGLEKRIEEFVENNEKTVILLDRLEFLTLHNPFQRIMGLVHFLNECVDGATSCAIICVDKETLSEKQQSLLFRETTTLE